MCFSRKWSAWEERAEEGREDRVRDLFDREPEREPPMPVAEHDREPDVAEAEEKVPAGAS
jgi:hypothetical protein